MSYPAPPADLPHQPALLNALMRIVWELRLVIGERTRPVWTTPVIPMALAELIVARLDRWHRRFHALAVRALAGRLPPVRPRGARSLADRAARTGAPPRSPEAIRAPRGAGWLLKLCPQSEWITQRSLGGPVLGLSRFLEDETLLGLLAADARFGRMLRPVWRMLHMGPPPACLALPERPRKPRVRRDKPDDGWRPPRGVTKKDLARSRAMAEPVAPVQPPPDAPQTQYGTMTDWTPTELTRRRRGTGVEFGGLKEPTLRPTAQAREGGWRTRWYRLGNGM